MESSTATGELVAQWFIKGEKIVARYQKRGWNHSFNVDFISGDKAYSFTVHYQTVPRWRFIQRRRDWEEFKKRLLTQVKHFICCRANEYLELSESCVNMAKSYSYLAKTIDLQTLEQSETEI